MSKPSVNHATAHRWETKPGRTGSQFIRDASRNDAPGAGLIMQALVIERYGFRLGVEQLSEVLGITKGAVYNQISAGTLPVKTYVDGGKRWADYRDVAEHLDHCRRMAA